MLNTVFDTELIDESFGYRSFIVSGEKASLFENESGGHRYQRIPPTETKGRVHTSTITVAVLPIPDQVSINLDEKDLEIITTRGSGPGGQHRNKTDTCVCVKHKPTGITVRSDAQRSQLQNKTLAINILKARLEKREEQILHQASNETRKEQIGSGERGDKIRTYREQDDQVVDHRSKNKFSLTQWRKGKIFGE